MLKGILRCVPCGCAMTPSHTTRKAEGTMRYRYYVCSSAQKRGWHTCPSKSIPAAQIEELVVKQIQRVGRDPKVLQEALAEARRQDEARTVELRAEQREREKELRGWHAEIRTLAAEVTKAKDGSAMAKLAEVQGRIAAGEERLRLIRTELDATKNGRMHPDEAKLALSAFESIPSSSADDHRTRMPTSSGSAVESAGIVWITSSRQARSTWSISARSAQTTTTPSAPELGTGADLEVR